MQKNIELFSDEGSKPQRCCPLLGSSRRGHTHTHTYTLLGDLVTRLLAAAIPQPHAGSLRAASRPSPPPDSRSWPLALPLGILAREMLSPVPTPTPAFPRTCGAPCSTFPPKLAQPNSTSISRTSRASSPDPGSSESRSCRASTPPPAPLDCSVSRTASAPSRAPGTCTTRSHGGARPEPPLVATAWTWEGGGGAV